jgi:hypothetical protein
VPSLLAETFPDVGAAEFDATIARRQRQKYRKL